MSDRSTGAKRFHPLEPPRNLSGELVARLSDEITSGRLQPNERLPTEQEMIASFGVSRTVVREAIAALRAEGLVETRQGAGAFVARDMSRRPFRIDPSGLRSIDGVLDVMELRMGIEIEAAGLAADRRTVRDLKAIARSLTAFAEAIDRGEEAIEADYDFHRAICEATGNDYFVSFLEFLGRHIIPRRSIRVSQQSERARRSYLKKVLSEHKAIFRAIEAGQPASARTVMRSHLEKGRARYVKLSQQATEA